jgi:hypothetical protein
LPSLEEDESELFPEVASADAPGDRGGVLVAALGGAVGVPCRSVCVIMLSYAGRGGVAGGAGAGGGGGDDAAGELGGKYGSGFVTTEPRVVGSNGINNTEECKHR